MMIRGLTVSFLFAVLAAPAYAQDSEPTPPPQDNPETRQTDQSEDDYRRSQRRRGIEDIFEDIDINTRGSGNGTILGREVKAIDRLDPESRRHLNKQRAKALAEAQPGEPIDAAYKPSETAKSDEYVAKQEEKAWKEMMEEANSGLSGIQGQGGGSGGGSGSGQGSQAGNGQAGNGQPGQNGQGQSGSGHSGQSQSGQGNGNSSAGQASLSPLRGGSASSAASILDQIKGRSELSNRAGQQSGSAGTPPGSTPQAGQNSQTRQALQNTSAPSGTRQNDAQASSDASSDNGAAGQSVAQNNTQSQAQADAQAQAGTQASAEATNDADHAAAHRDTISPLERLKRDPVEREDVGGRTSASDYLKRKKN